jgi:ABC-type amino acid transport substrate-binding protein
MRIMVSKEYPDGLDLLEKINAGLQEIKETGEYEAIRKRYGL